MDIDEAVNIDNKYYKKYTEDEYNLLSQKPKAERIEINVNNKSKVYYYAPLFWSMKGKVIGQVRSISISEAPRKTNRNDW